MLKHLSWHLAVYCVTQGVASHCCHTWHVTRDTHPRHISIFSYCTLWLARAWRLTTGRAICRGNNAPRLRLLRCVQPNHHHYVNYARKVSLSATFSRYGLYQDFTPYTLNIQDSEHCPGGTLPHASPPHALAQAVKSKAKNFNWPFPLFPTPHCLLVLTAPSLARIQSRVAQCLERRLPAKIIIDRWFG